MESAPLTPAETLSLPQEWTFFHGTEATNLDLAAVEQLAALLQETHAGSSPRDASATTLSQADIVELATQTWRLEKRVQAMDPNVDPRAFKQFSDSVRRFGKLLQRLDVGYEDVTNKPYTSGWQEVEVVGWEDPDGTPSPVPSGPWVKQTVSPILRRAGRIMKLGQVLCVDTPDA